MSENSDIADWFAGKSVFITGGTGLLGKVLIEKLLRSCPDVGPIYILIRRKKGCESRERVKKLMESRIFNIVKKNLGDLTTRIHAIPGDLSEPHLGINQKDKEILRKTVSIVFHSAATVKFTESLRSALTLNVAATKALMELCCEMEKLEAAIHVSTAYANCDKKIIEERIYEAPADVHKSLQWLDNFNDDILNFITPKLLKNYPNTYTYTKALGEQIVNEYSRKLPIAIVRPSIVTASWKEPEPGWIDSYSGPTGVFINAKLGFSMSLPSDGNYILDIIPIDVCVNVIIAAAWQTGKGRSYESKIPIYNTVSGPFKPITLYQFVEYFNLSNNRYTMSGSLSASVINMPSTRLEYFLRWNIFDYILASIKDLFVWSTRKKPIFRYMHKKIDEHLRVLEFFMINQWIFEINNIDRLHQELSPADQRIFDFNIRDINWKEYMNQYTLGIRKNIMKQDDKSISAVQRKMAIFKMTSRVIKYAILISSGYFAFNYCKLNNWLLIFR